MRSKRNSNNYIFLTLIIFISTISVPLFGTNSCQNNIGPSFSSADHVKISTEILLESDYAILLKKSNGNIDWYEVIATVSTELIPLSVLGICIYTTGNIRACNAIYHGIEVLVEIRKDEIKEGVKDGLKWIVKRTKSIGSLTIQTDNYEDAKAAMHVFNEYRKRDCFSWDKVKLLNSDGILCMPANENINATYDETVEWLENKLSKHNYNIGRKKYEKTVEFTYESRWKNIFGLEKLIIVNTVERENHWLTKYSRSDIIYMEQVDTKRLKIKKDKYNNYYILIKSINNKPLFEVNNIIPLPYSEKTHVVRLYIPSDRSLQGRILYALSYAVNKARAKKGF